MRLRIPYGKRNRNLSLGGEMGEYNIRYECFDQVGQIKIYKGKDLLMRIEDRGPGCRLWLWLCVERPEGGSWDYPQFMISRRPLPNMMWCGMDPEIAHVAYTALRHIREQFGIRRVIAAARYERADRAEMIQRAKSQL